MYSFPNFKPVHCSMSGSNCCFLSCIQVSQEAGKVVWYSHLFKKFSQFVVIHKVKGFSIVSEANVFWNLLLFLWSSRCWSEKAMAPHSSTFAWRIPGTGEPGGLPSMGLQSRTRLKWLSSSSSSKAYGKRQWHPLQHSCLENPMGRGAW